MKETLVIHLKNKVLSFDVEDFGDSAVNTEELLQVDYNSILLDIITFPVLFNRISMIKAQIEDFLRQTQLDFDIFMAQKKDEFRKSLVQQVDDGKGKGGYKMVYPTIGEVDDAVTRSPEFKVKKNYLNQVKKEVDIIDGLYWAAKSKDQKLNAISLKLTPEEFENEIIQGKVNGVMIKVHPAIGSNNK